MVEIFLAKERLEFLNWVSSIDFEKTHQDTFAKKHNKTGDWLINHPDYQQWFSGQGSSLLWCHGKRKHYCIYIRTMCFTDNSQRELVRPYLRKCKVPLNCYLENFGFDCCLGQTL